MNAMQGRITPRPGHWPLLDAAATRAAEQGRGNAAARRITLMRRAGLAVARLTMRWRLHAKNHLDRLRARQQRRRRHEARCTCGNGASSRS
jgi:hypothetical protein